MISILVSLSLILTPVLPRDIPATMIYLGANVEPIHTLKVKKGFVVGDTSIMLTPFNFIRIKSILEGSPDLCSYAIDSAVDECLQGMNREQTIALNREHDDAIMIKAYEFRLTRLEESLSTSYKHRNVLLYSIGAVSLVAVASLSLLVWGR